MTSMGHLFVDIIPYLERWRKRERVIDFQILLSEHDTKATTIVEENTEHPDMLIARKYKVFEAITKFNWIYTPNYLIKVNTRE